MTDGIHAPASVSDAKAPLNPQQRALRVAAGLPAAAPAKPVDFDPDERWDTDVGGLQYSVRRVRYEEIFREKYDPQEFARKDWTPDPGLVAAAEDTFGDYYKSGRLIFSMHPWFNRVGLFERVLNPEHGEQCYELVQLFHDWRTIKEGYLPDDLEVYDRRYEDLRGMIGDFIQPHREWLEWIAKRCDRHRVSTKEALRFLNQEWKDHQAETTRIHGDYLHDFHSHYFNFFRDVANIEAGSGSFSMQCNQTSLDEVRARIRKNLFDAEQTESGVVIYHKKVDPWTDGERAWARGDRENYHRARKDQLDRMFARAELPAETPAGQAAREYSEVAEAMLDVWKDIPAADDWFEMIDGEVVDRRPVPHRDKAQAALAALEPAKA